MERSKGREEEIGRRIQRRERDGVRCVVADYTQFGINELRHRSAADVSAGACGAEQLEAIRVDDSNAKVPIRSVIADDVAHSNEIAARVAVPCNGNHNGRQIGSVFNRFRDGAPDKIGALSGERRRAAIADEVASERCEAARDIWLDAADIVRDQRVLDRDRRVVEVANAASEVGPRILSDGDVEEHGAVAVEVNRAAGTRIISAEGRVRHDEIVRVQMQRAALIRAVVAEGGSLNREIAFGVDRTATAVGFVRREFRIGNSDSGAIGDANRAAASFERFGLGLVQCEARVGDRCLVRVDVETRASAADRAAGFVFCELTPHDHSIEVRAVERETAAAFIRCRVLAEGRLRDRHAERTADVAVRDKCTAAASTTL